jgi:hypothetical protein
MPRADDLSDNRKNLTRRQGIEISHTRFDSDMDRLTRALSEIDGDVRRDEAKKARSLRGSLKHTRDGPDITSRYGVNPKTIAKWKARSSVPDLPTGPKKSRPTVLTVEEEAVVVAFRRHTLLPLDDRLSFRASPAPLEQVLAVIGKG